MAQPNAAREPSMEEILASIRRIIETNEPTSDGSFARPQPSAYDEDELDAEEAGFAPELAANDRGQPSQTYSQQPYSQHDYAVETSAPMVAPVAERPAERSLSLADVAARVRAASVRQQDAAMGRSSAPPADAPSMADRDPVAAPVAPAFEHVELRASIPPMDRQPAPEAKSFEPLERNSQPPQPVSRFETSPRFEARSPEPRHVEPVPVEPQPLELSEAELRAIEPEPTSLPAKIEETARLLSAEAGAQVAQSFNDLAAVFNGLELRSVEDMAQEMLRPMLQEWLDDNLPTLVERLVREEIERVARGPRR